MSDFIWQLKRDLTTPIRRKELEREERRSIFVLGLLAATISVRFGAKDGDQFVVFGVSYNLVAVLNLLLSAWIAYSILMLVFMSDDLFSSRRGLVVRRLAGIAGILIALEVPLILGWVMLLTPTLFYLPPVISGGLIVLPLVLPVFYLYVLLLLFIRRTRHRK